MQCWTNSTISFEGHSGQHIVDHPVLARHRNLTHRDSNVIHQIDLAAITHVPTRSTQTLINQHTRLRLRSQTVHRIQAEITRRSLDVRDHELIKYIADQVGTVALVAALPEWVRLIVTVEPSPLDDDWGTPNDFAQFVTAVALGDSGFVTHAAEGGESEEAHWWITPERAEIGPTMATLALEITAGRSRVWSPSDLEHELGRCGVVRNHRSPVIDAMKAGRRLLWIPSTQRYVVFAHDPSRSSRGSAPDRATDAMRLLADRDPDALEAELIAEFVAQHGLKPDSAAAAVRSARSEVR